MQVAAAYRPAHKAAPKRAIVTPRSREPTAHERERVLATRVRITDRTLERLLPTAEQTITRRLSNYRAAVPAETLAKLQLTRAEYMTFSLQSELRPAREEVDQQRHFLKPPHEPSGVPHKGPAHKGARPSKVQLQRLLEKPRAMLSYVPGLDLKGFDLAYQDFRAAALVEASMDGASLRGAAMAETTLSHASLRSCSMQSATLDSAVLQSTDLSGANLSHASFKNADLSLAKLEGAILGRTDLTGASLRHARLDGASASFTILTGCDLTGASLRGLQLAGVVGLDTCTLDNLRGADLTACDVTGVDLRGIDLNGACLNGVIHLEAANLDNLRGTLLAGCNFRGVKLGGIDLSGADLTGASFAGVAMDSPALAEGCNVDAFPLGTVETVGAGAIIHFSGYIIPVTASHAANQTYAYYREPGTSWARAIGKGCFEKRFCRVLAPSPQTQ